MSSIHEALGLISIITVNGSGDTISGMQEAEEGGLEEVEGHPLLHSEFEIILGYSRPCVKQGGRGLITFQFQYLINTLSQMMTIQIGNWDEPTDILGHP